MNSRKQRRPQPWEKLEPRARYLEPQARGIGGRARSIGKMHRA